MASRGKLERWLVRYPFLKIKREPSVDVLLQSAGAFNGVSEEQVFQRFKKFDPNLRVNQLTNDAFIILKFSQIQNAISAVSSVKERDKFEGCLGDKSSIRLYYIFDCEEFYRKYESEKLSYHPASNPPGLELREDFIIPEEESFLISKLQQELEQAENESSLSMLRHRKSIHYGYVFDYSTNTPQNVPCKPIPNFLVSVIERLVQTGVFPSNPDQITVNFYTPKGGIPPHVDNTKNFTDAIVSLSLISGVSMNFAHATSQMSHCCWLQPRSLLKMSGDCRYLWTHGITPKSMDFKLNLETNRFEIIKRQDRISITFRKVILFDQSPDVGANSEVDMKEIEDKFVVETYDRISEHFSATRVTPWPSVEEFINSLPPYSLVFDVGCGNGKYVNSQYSIPIHWIGSDRSFPLLEEAQHIATAHSKDSEIPSRSLSQFFSADIVDIPLRDCTFDHVICIAVFHHLSSLQRREKALGELIRVIKPLGMVFLTVWSSSVNDNRAMRKAISLNTPRDFLVPWTVRKIESDGKMNEEVSTVMRYYHLYTENELRELCSSFGKNLRILELKYVKGNWNLLLQKL